MDSTPPRVNRLRCSATSASFASTPRRRVNFPVVCCHCILSKYAIVQTREEHFGRRYYGCLIHPAEGHCKFFIWEDELLAFVQSCEEQSTADLFNSVDQAATSKISRLKAKNNAIKEVSVKEKLKAQQQASRAKSAYFALLISWVFFAIYKRM